MPIKAITIDFWNTLFDSSNGKQRNDYRIKELIKQVDKFGLVFKRRALDEAMKASWEYFNNIWIKETRTPSAMETVSFFWRYLKLPEDKASEKIVADAFADSINAYPPGLMEGAKDALKKLSAEYKLAIISDTGFSPGTMLRELMRDNGVGEYFNTYSFSDETGVSKPEPLAFTYALDQLQCLPGDAVHIGDIEFTDVRGAKNIGMKAIRFKGDLTSFTIKENPVETIADAEAEHWNDIYNIILNLR